MKSRTRQRAALREKLLAKKCGEEPIAYRNHCGIPDPTPFEAMQNWIRSEKTAAAAGRA